MLASVFPVGVLYCGRREEETCTLPLEFLLGQVTGNAARNRSSPEPLCAGGALQSLYLHILNGC